MLRYKIGQGFLILIVCLFGLFGGGGFENFFTQIEAING